MRPHQWCVVVARSQWVRCCMAASSPLLLGSARQAAHMLCRWYFAGNGSPRILSFLLRCWMSGIWCVCCGTNLQSSFFRRLTRQHRSICSGSQQDVAFTPIWPISVLKTWNTQMLFKPNYGIVVFLSKPPQFRIALVLTEQTLAGPLFK